MRFARNKKEGKNGQKPFCPSTKITRKRAKTIMVVRYKNGVFDIDSEENQSFWAILCHFPVQKKQKIFFEIFLR